MLISSRLNPAATGQWLETCWESVRQARPITHQPPNLPHELPPTGPRTPLHHGHCHRNFLSESYLWVDADLVLEGAEDKHSGALPPGIMLAASPSEDRSPHVHLQRPRHALNQEQTKLTRLCALQEPGIWLGKAVPRQRPCFADGASHGQSTFIPPVQPPTPTPPSPPHPRTHPLLWLHSNLKPHDTCAQPGMEWAHCTTSAQLAPGPAPLGESPCTRAASSALTLRAL